VKNITSFGCFVEIFPGKEGLCHISELSNRKLARVEDFVNEGDLLDVKLIEINARGQLRLSHRATLDNERVEEEDRKPELASAGKETL
jgi:polyribonucleotide nucleotidyltransferase